MIKKTIRLIFFFLFSLALLQCERDINFHFPDSEPQLALICHFKDGAVFRSTLTKIKQVEDTSEYLVPENATVKVLKDGTTLEYLTPQIDFFTKQTVWLGKTAPIVGAQYKIQAEAPGFPTAVGESALPLLTTQPIIELAPESAWTILNDPKLGPSTEIPISIKIPGDFKNARNLFAFKLRAMMGYYDQSPAHHLVDSIFVPTSISGDLVNETLLTSDDITGLNNDKIYLADEISWNADDKINFKITLAGFMQGFRPLKLIINWWTLSPQYYDFLWSTNRQNLYSPFIEPIVIFNNIDGGLGNVAGYREQVLTIRF